jgi:hypothetical protein
MSAGLRVNVVAEKKPFHRPVIAAGVASLIAGGEGIVDRALETEGFPADGVNHRVTLPAQFGVFSFEAGNGL